MRALNTLLVAALFAVLAFKPATAQQGTIAGQVVTEMGQQPVSAAQVSIGALEVGTLSQADGGFRLENVPAGTHTLAVQRIGFQSAQQEVTVIAGQTTQVTFGLSEQRLALDALVVTGVAGGTQRRAVGNVVEQLNVAEVLERSPVVNIEQALGGRMPGVMIQPAAGDVGGDGARIRIRGSSSVSLSNDPLIYVDGVRVHSSPSFQGTVFSVSRLQDINPADIESIEVIKGPAAATLYGTEAANGVIQIITKRGAVGTPVWTASLGVGASWLPSPETKVGTTYGISPISRELISHNLVETEKERSGNDLFQYGPLRNASVGVSGGTQVVRYSASFNTAHREGIVDWSTDSRSSARAGIQIIAREDLEFSLSGSFLQSETSPGAIFGNLLWANPSTALDAGGLDDARRGFYIRPPEAERDGREETFTADRSTWSAEVRYTPRPWFSNRVVMGSDYSGETREAITFRDPQGLGRFWGVAGREGLKIVDDITTRVTSVDYGGTVTVNVSPSLLSSTSFGMQYNSRDIHTRGARGEQFATRPLTTVSAAAQTFGSETTLTNTTLGVYLQQQMDWEQRIFLTGAVRMDDNSAFGTEFDAAVYPKLSATWVLHEEPFWTLDWVEQLRLRGAWGAAGQQPDVFAAQRLYRSEPGAGDQPIITPEAFGNPDLAPERGEELELGFDASFMDGRVGLEVTRYWRTTTDGIVARPLPPSVGFPGSQFVNVGQSKNWGFESALNLRLVTDKPVLWDMDIAFSTQNNRVDDLGESEVIPIRRGQRHIEGFPLGAVHNPIVRSAEFRSGNRGPVTSLMCDGGIARGGGFVAGGETVPCSEAPLIYVGPGEPTWMLSVAQTFTIGENLQLNATVDAMGGHHLLHDGNAARHTSFQNTLQSNVQDDPIFMAYRQLWRQGLATHEGGFAKLRELSVNYTLPQEWAGRMGATRASMSFGVRNVATLWIQEEVHPVGQIALPDPEMSFSGGDNQGFFGEPTTVAPPLSQAVLTFRFTF